MKDSCQNTPKISDSQNQYEELKQIITKLNTNVEDLLDKAKTL